MAERRASDRTLKVTRMTLAYCLSSRVRCAFAWPLLTDDTRISAPLPASLYWISPWLPAGLAQRSFSSRVRCALAWPLLTDDTRFSAPLPASLYRISPMAACWAGSAFLLLACAMCVRPLISLDHGFDDFDWFDDLDRFRLIR